MELEDKNRRDFLKIGGATLAAAAVPAVGSWTATGYAAIVGANDRVRVALIGAGDRAKGALVPAFQEHAKELNFEFVAVSDIWNRRRDEGAAFIQKECGGAPIATVRNNESFTRARMSMPSSSPQRFSACPARRRSGAGRTRCVRGEAHCSHHGGCANVSGCREARQEKS